MISMAVYGTRMQFTGEKIAFLGYIETWLQALKLAPYHDLIM